MIELANIFYKIVRVFLVRISPERKIFKQIPGAECSSNTDVPYSTEFCPVSRHFCITVHFELLQPTILDSC